MQTPAIVADVTASLHKLSAGDGYTYLTRQVAAADSTELGQNSLSDYYSAKGESPGQWRGEGLTSLGRIKAGDQVTEDHMLALFGVGEHPAAEAIYEEVRAAEEAKGARPKDAIKTAEKARRLGAKYGDFKDEPSDFIVRVTRAYRDFNKARGASRDSVIPDEERAAIRTRIGRETFVELHGREPLDNRELSGHVARMSRPPRKAVAGYDVTFSPVKSVSTLWALAPREVAEEIEAAHQAAVEDAMDWVESTVSYTRRGKAGVRQVDIKGLLMAQFTHRDSRAGDPDLHTHVALSNKVEAMDGTWLALDGQPLHQALVSASERYNTRLEAEVVERLGVSFVERKEPGRGEKRAVREIDGVDPELMKAWSSRRAMIDARRSELAAEFTAAHGRTPTPKEAIALAQQATLETREAKHEPRSLAEQRTAWREQAEAHFEAKGVAHGVETMLDTVRSTLGPQARILTSTEREDLAAATLHTLESSRAQWQMVHVRAEVERRIRAAGVGRSNLDEHVEDCVSRVLSPASSVRLDRQLKVKGPERRRDGQSVYERAHQAMYTSERVQDAERRILAAARDVDARRIGEDQVAIALLEAAANGTTLDPGQAAMVTATATSGARVQLGLAPAGSGKTTAMRALAKAWEGTGGTVIGLAPSAAASTELGSSIGTDADTLSKLVWHIERPEVAAPEWMSSIDERTLVIVDEAGMASTPDLAATVDFITSRGGSIRLIGDDQQLAAVGAGGVLRDVASEVGAVHLTRLHRFTDPAEGEATLGLRSGDTEALGYYLDQGRVHVAADSDSVIGDVFEAWKRDTEAGQHALMLAATNETVTALNDLARTHRLGGVEPEGPSAVLASGLRASAGDRIVTRRNDRRLRITSTHWVKNGDRFTVREVGDDGSLVAVHQETGRALTLPAEYVAHTVDLGYASTYHGAQGSTVDVTHCALTGTESRQLFYVGMSRGRAANHAYVPVSGDGDPHNNIHPDVVTPRTAVDVLEGIIRRDDAPRSARTIAREENDATLRLRGVVERYVDALDHAAEVQLGRARVEELTTQAEALHPGLTDCRAWEVLLAHLCRIDIDTNGHAVDALRDALEGKDLTSARDVAAVVDWRLDPAASHGGGVGPLPWLPEVSDLSDPAWMEFLTALREDVAETAEEVLADSAERAPAAWATGLDGALRSDLTIWRAAQGIPDDDLSPTGPPQVAVRVKRYQAALEARVAEQRSDSTQVSGRWERLLENAALVSDPYWPVLTARLDAAALEGVDVEQLVEGALAKGPLPDEHAAAALVSRFTSALAPDSDLASRLRPTWVPALIAPLGETHASTVMSDRHWRELVALLQGAQARGHDPAAVVAAAVSMIDLASVGTPSGLPHDALASVLVWKASEILDLEESSPGEEVPPEDFADYFNPEWESVFQPPEDERAFRTVPEVDEPLPSPEDLDPVLEEPGSVTSRARLLELTSAAGDYYQQTLTGSKAETYLRSRTGEADLSRYVIGYAPSGWTGLIDHLRQDHAASDEELVDAGLAKWSRRGTLYDVFRERLVFGLHDTHGDLVGFVGRRAPGNEDGPKYLNTPETDIFHKRAVLFGLHEGHDDLTAGAVPVRVEGTMDAIAVTAASGGRAVGVAPLGTALSGAQADMLAAASGENRTVVVAADNDRAGLAAAERDYWELVDREVTPLALPVPGSDPAAVWESTPEALRAMTALADASPSLASEVIEHRIAAHESDLQHGWVHARVHAARAVAPVIASTPMSDWAGHVTDVAQQLGDCDSEQMVWTEVLAAAIPWNPLVDDPAVGVEHGHVTEARRELAALASALNVGDDSPASQRPRDAIAALSDALTEKDAEVEERRRRTQRLRDEATDAQRQGGRRTPPRDDRRRDDPSTSRRGPRR